MRQWGVFVTAACMVATSLMTAACGSDSPSSPSSSSNTVVFTANLSPANEVPPITNADASGRGTATITMHLTRNSANAIQSGTVDFQYTVSGFPAGTLITGAHIHPGAAGATGSVLISTGLTAASAIGLPNGSGSAEALGISGTGTDAATLQSIIDNPGNFYFNIHTTISPGGAARGQLVKQ